MGEKKKSPPKSKASLGMSELQKMLVDHGMTHC